MLKRHAAISDSLFSVPITRRNEYTPYQVPSDEIYSSSIAPILTDRLQEMDADQLRRYTKRRVLTKSAHKGKLLASETHLSRPVPR